jgi:hypothetical protein
MLKLAGKAPLFCRVGVAAEAGGEAGGGLQEDEREREFRRTCPR